MLGINLTPARLAIEISSYLSKTLWFNVTYIGQVGQVGQVGVLGYRERKKKISATIRGYLPTYLHRVDIE